MTSDERARRLALNEALIRDVNEAVVGLAQDWFASDERVEFRCECVRADCDATLSLTLEQYGEARATATRFLVAPGHAEPTVETVVRDLGGAHVVEKMGPGRRVAEERDPRRHADG